MDNVCHSMMGAALGKAGLARRTTLGMSTLVIANNLPDLDVAVFATNTLVMSFRRGWTHGVLARPCCRSRWRSRCSPWHLCDGGEGRGYATRGGPQERRADAARLSSACSLHVFMDFLNSYGVRLLMPFSDRWFYGDACTSSIHGCTSRSGWDGGWRATREARRR